jgi:hypothetical protein
MTPHEIKAKLAGDYGSAPAGGVEFVKALLTLREVDPRLDLRGPAGERIMRLLEEHGAMEEFQEELIEKVSCGEFSSSSHPPRGGERRRPASGFRFRDGSGSQDPRLARLECLPRFEPMEGRHPPRSARQKAPPREVEVEPPPSGDRGNLGFWRRVKRSAQMPRGDRGINQ